MITDSQIMQVYAAMEKICNEVNSMMVALDDLMKGKKFEQFSPLRWETSEAIGAPGYWLPYFSQRQYRKKGHLKRAAGFQILLKDNTTDNSIPFITCGISESDKELPTKNDDFYVAGWHDEEIQNSRFKINNTPFCYSKSESCVILSYFLRLTAISNQNDLNEMVVKPMAKLFETIHLNQFEPDNISKSNSDNISSIINLISKAVISIDTIKGPS